VSDRRAFVIVLDACGAGELPDSAEYGDAGANTLGHVAEVSGGLDVPVTAAHERPAQPIRVGVDRRDGRSLRADEAVAEDVLAVAAGAGDPAVFDGERQAAGGLAQRTDPQGCGHSAILRPALRAAPLPPT